MKGIIRRLRPSPAMVVACIALVFAMTGAGYAAGMLGPNTVGTKQLKKNAVISSKVKNRSLLARRLQGRAGAGRARRGPQGLPGRAGPPGPARDLGRAGPQSTRMDDRPSSRRRDHGLSTTTTRHRYSRELPRENAVPEDGRGDYAGTVNDPSFRGTAVAELLRSAGVVRRADQLRPPTNPENCVFVGELTAAIRSQGSRLHALPSARTHRPRARPAKPSAGLPGQLRREAS